MYGAAIGIETIGVLGNGVCCLLARWNHEIVMVDL